MFRFGVFVASTMFVAVSVAAFRSESGLLRHSMLSKEIKQFEALNKHLNKENKRLEQEIELLKKSPRYIEHVIREDLGYVEPGEVVFITKPMRVR